MSELSVEQNVSGVISMDGVLLNKMVLEGMDDVISSISSANPYVITIKITDRDNPLWVNKFSSMKVSVRTSSDYVSSTVERTSTEITITFNSKQALTNVAYAIEFYLVAEVY